MFHQGTRPGVVALILGIALLAIPRSVLAQHGGGGGGRGMTGTGVSAGRPGGVSEKDDLKDFHEAIAMQATDEQRATFAKVAQYTQAASDQLKSFRELLQKAPASSPLSEPATTLDQAIAQARASNQNFLASFSAKQKSGLKDTAKKLEKADSDLDKQIKALDQVIQTSKPDSESKTEPIASSAATLDKALASFQSEQLALGREMSILFPAPGQDIAFTFPAIANSVTISGQPISIPASGAVSRTSSENGHNLFSLKLVADLSDLQLNITGVFRSQLNRSPRCGERIELQQATLTPLVPASLVVANLHFERWVCTPGQASPTEVADSDGTIEVRLTPSVEPTAGLRLVSEITRVNADGFLRNSLRSGDLGVTLREQIAAALLSALQKVADLKVTLPPVAQESATLQKAQFQDTGADQLSLVLDGQLQFSDEQIQQFAAQLKQRLSAQGAPAQ